MPLYAALSRHTVAHAFSSVNQGLHDIEGTIGREDAVMGGCWLAKSNVRYAESSVA